MLSFCKVRGVAQPGSALAWGASGRWFKSSRPDHLKKRVYSGDIFQADYFNSCLQGDLKLTPSTYSRGLFSFAFRCIPV